MNEASTFCNISAPECAVRFPSCRVLSVLVYVDYSRLDEAWLTLGIDAINVGLAFMLTDKDSDMRMCKRCKKAFIASRKGNEFCSQRCKNQFNVYKSREKKKRNKSDTR